MPDNDPPRDTLVARLHAEATRLSVSIASPASDERMNALLDELFVVFGPDQGSRPIGRITGDMEMCTRGNVAPAETRF